MANFITISKAARMPSSCWGAYRRIAVIEVDDGVVDVKMISERARGVLRVVRTWERLHVGTSGRCAFRRAMAEAIDLEHQLNEANG